MILNNSEKLVKYNSISRN